MSQPAPAHTDDHDNNELMSISILIATTVSCVWPVVDRIGSWTLGRVAVYSTAALLYTMLLAFPSRTPLVAWLRDHLGPFLVVAAALGLIMQLLSRNGAIQPFVFMLPMVYAAHRYSRKVLIRVMFAFVCLMVASLMLVGLHRRPSFFWTVFAHIGSMTFVTSFGYLSASERRARHEAENLKRSLALERDYLDRLVRITATLPRELDLVKLLSQIAFAGQALAQAEAVRIWLCRDDVWSLAASAGQASAASAAPPMGEHSVHLMANDVALGAIEIIPGPAGMAMAETKVRLRPFFDTAALAIANAQLYEQAHGSATLAERNRLAREFHDTLAQQLTALRLQLEAAEAAWSAHPSRAYQRLIRANELSRITLEGARQSVWALSQPLLEQRQLAAVIRDLADSFEHETGIAVRVTDVGLERALDPDVLHHISRIVGEALNNVNKHAVANTVDIRLVWEEEAVHILVQDNGRGFAAHPSPAQEGHGFGIQSMRERARLANATLSVDSHAGEGTRVRLTVQTPIFTA